MERRRRVKERGRRRVKGRGRRMVAGAYDHLMVVHKLLMVVSTERIAQSTCEVHVLQDYQCYTVWSSPLYSKLV